MSALFDFRSFVCVLLLTICTCTYVKIKGALRFFRTTTRSGELMGMRLIMMMIMMMMMGMLKNKICVYVYSAEPAV